MTSIRLHVRSYFTFVAALLATVGPQVVRADAYATEVDEAFTNIEDEDCGGDCIGEPANALGPPDFVAGQGGTTVSLGRGGTLGLIFFDEPCMVDDDTSTPDIIVCERGGVQVEDFYLDAVPPGEQALSGSPVLSTTSVDQPERYLDLTAVVGAGSVETIQIIDLDDPPDEPEPDEPDDGSEVARGADIDSVVCNWQTMVGACSVGTGGNGGGGSGGNGGDGGDSGIGVDGGDNGEGSRSTGGGCGCRVEGDEVATDALLWLLLVGLWLGYRRRRRGADRK